MTAEEIRKIPVIGLDTKIDGTAVDDAAAAMHVNTNALLREIAAQLAELNHTQEWANTWRERPLAQVR